MGPKHATILSLLSVEEIDHNNLCRWLGVDSCTFIPSSDIKDKPRSEIPGYINKIHKESGGGVFAIFCHDWDRQANRAALYTLACMVPSQIRVAVDRAGNVRSLTWGGLLSSEYPSAVSQFFAGRKLVGDINRKIDEGLKETVTRYPVAKGSIKNIIYMKTDLWFGIIAGGSVGHVARTRTIDHNRTRHILQECLGTYAPFL
ncbi:MAG: hypothetical protein NTY09_10975 [bacterium]|nr:hypothetical protein [bacterium]